MQEWARAFRVQLKVSHEGVAVLLELMSAASQCQYLDVYGIADMGTHVDVNPLNIYRVAHDMVPSCARTSPRGSRNVI